MSQTICTVQLHIDVPLLRKQRDLLLSMVIDAAGPVDGLLDGLILLLDSMLDACEEEEQDV